jgi:acyl-coenzyme A thioesterase PaaI-like protein
MEVDYDGRCFGCGPLNEEGLRMTFVPEDGVSFVEFEVPARYQSWKGVVHGGIVALLLDEAVGWAAWHAGHPGVTGKLEVRFRQPMRLGERVRIAGRVEEIRRSLVRATGWIDRLTDGARVADASATLMEVAARTD